jgi:signal transduction histidine kinase/CheY-like chemotaxis protein
VTDTDSTLLDAAMMRWFQDLADHGIFTTDDALVIRTWNGWLESQTGWAAATVIGRPVADVIPGFVARGLDRYYVDALGGEVRILSERLHRYLVPITRSFHAAGLTEMAQAAQIAPLLAGGRVIGTITVVDDVTERVISERELRNQIAVSERARQVAEEASKLKDEFLATLSHEIRTPLNAVLGWARILRTQPNIRSRSRALEVIERNAASQLRLVEDLLDMARVITGKLRLDIETVSLANVAEEAIEVIRPAAEARQIIIVREIEDPLPPVNGDAERLQQVAWNLLSNAVKFTEPGGTVTVRVRRDGEHVELSVLDTGEGISAEFLPFVFDRFRQADSSTSRRHGGLGLGLALVRQMIELHGGEVSVESEGPRRGSSFRVRLPAGAGGVIPHAPREDRPVTLEGISVLIVDDNDEARELLGIALEGYGATITTVSSARQALERIQRNLDGPDVLISDVAMPGSDGYDLIRQVRALPPPLSALPAIAVTAYANPDDRIRALVAGFQHHVPKPVDAAVLAATVAGLVGPALRPDSQRGGNSQ